MREYDDALLRHSHKGLEAISRAVGAIRENNVGEAARALTEAQKIITALLKKVDNPSRELTANPDQSDKG